MMPPRAPDQTLPFDNRSSSLDGVRGLAALSVVLLHILSIFQDTEIPEYAWVNHALDALAYTPIAALWAGSSAVVLFFILSGYALHRMFSPGRMTYAGYVARRITRLWLPYAVTLILASLSIWLIGSHKIAGQSNWLNSSLGTSLSAPILIQHMLMVGEFDTRPLDFVIWSLVIEMRVSLIFPLIFWAAECNRPLMTLVISIIVGATSILAQHRLGASATSMIATLGYQTYFVIGALMSKHEMLIRRHYARIPRAARLLLFLVALTLYCGVFRLSATYETMLGASWIIVAALCSANARKFLEWSPIQWLGQMSYSLYLCHVVALLSLVNLWYPRLTFSEIAGLSIPVIFIATMLLHRFVEQPAIALSRIVARQFGGGVMKAAMRT
jgi:peptidoglycan/LPS O-acetylase OafA/YrhL